MSEIIRYAFGRSSLGDFVTAMSDRGLVALEFGERAALVAGLRQNVPDATLVEDEAGLSAVVEALGACVDHPERGAAVPLDCRGSDYQKRVWEMLREIPAGQTTTYGAIAAKLGTRDAREVTAAIASNSIAILVPCHRVVKRYGSLSGYRWGFWRKRALLARERETPGIATNPPAAP